MRVTPANAGCPSGGAVYASTPDGCPRPRLYVRREDRELAHPGLPFPARCRGSSPPQAFTPPLDEPELRDLRWYLELYAGWPMGEDKARAERIEAGLEDWGRALWTARSRARMPPACGNSSWTPQTRASSSPSTPPTPACCVCPGSSWPTRAATSSRKALVAPAAFPRRGLRLLRARRIAATTLLLGRPGRQVAIPTSASARTTFWPPSASSSRAPQPGHPRQLRVVLGRDPRCLSRSCGLSWMRSGPGNGAKGKGDGATGSRVLITTRDTTFADDRFAPSQPCAHLGLEGLAMPDAARSGRGRARRPRHHRAVGRQALVDLMDRLGGHPLSLYLVLPRLR